MKLHVISAIFRRNFVSYFSNPTGYVFICVFVLLIGFATFWPNEFFNNNLANLDQLNRYLPLIMLVFIPAITMGIWAEERRQGTDELLLTIPAGDFEVVIGKYLSAVAIFSVSLLFSAVANWIVFLYAGSARPGPLSGHVLRLLDGGPGDACRRHGGLLPDQQPDGGLHPGHGLQRSAGLRFLGRGNLLAAPGRRASKDWSLAEKFRDFGQGVISLAGLGYFLLIVGVMLYISMVLIGRRHWVGGRDGHSMFGHYLVRALALVAGALAINLLITNVQALNRLRSDWTAAQAQLAVAARPRSCWRSSIPNGLSSSMPMSALKSRNRMPRRAST